MARLQIEFTLAVLGQRCRYPARTLPLGKDRIRTSTARRTMALAAGWTPCLRHPTARCCNRFGRKFPSTRASSRIVLPPQPRWLHGCGTSQFRCIGYQLATKRPSNSACPVWGRRILLNRHPFDSGCTARILAISPRIERQSILRRT